ncbi:hypothetical protein [Salininema proteolyticum]|uniref:Uncharacterized protein n=1 Tax=Salininema proteolyticum TaxID=1607685 RepID=A0ABV8TTG7_9ACTN
MTAEPPETPAYLRSGLFDDAETGRGGGDRSVPADGSAPEPEPFDADGPFDLQRLHAYLLARGTADGGSQTAWGIANLLRSQQDDMWKRIAEQVEDGEISYWDIPMDEDVRSAVEEGDDETVDMLRTIARSADPTSQSGQGASAGHGPSPAPADAGTGDGGARTSSDQWRPDDEEDDEDPDFDPDYRPGRDGIDPDAAEMWGVAEDSPYD